MDVDVAPPSQNVRAGSGGVRGGFRGGGRGTFSGDAQSFRPERRNDKTLVVEKIPEDKLSLDTVNSWFKRFGTVTNVAIDARTAKALVSFSDHSEAHAAWKSEDAVFGTRFVKVFWHRPMEGHGQKGARMLAASAPLIANIAARSATPTIPPAGTSTTTNARKPVATSNAAAELAAKQKLLEEQIAEQKSLMASLGTASAEEKKTIMARLRKLGEEMKLSSAPASIPGEASTSTTRPASSTEHPSQLDKERERLDKELDLRAVTGDESTADLQAKLAKLKEEVRVCIRSI
jgi:RNA-binding protein 26